MRRLNCLIDLGHKNKLFNFAIPYYILYGLFGIFLIATPIIVHFAYAYSKKIVDEARLVSLERENSFFKKKLSQFEERARTLGDRIQNLEKTDAKLRIATHLELVHSDLQELGTGGRRAEDDSIDADLPGYRRTKALANSLEYLLSKVSYQEQSFKSIEEHLKSQAHKRDHTPSIRPCAGFFMSGFGYRIDPFTGRLRMHEGLDIAGPIGTSVVSTADGVVTFVGAKAGYGLSVEIDHGYGIHTFYAHCELIKVGIGQFVRRGETIALMGNTGRSVGPHLHYEITISERKVNPLNYILIETASFD